MERKRVEKGRERGGILDSVGLLKKASKLGRVWHPRYSPLALLRNHLNRVFMGSLVFLLLFGPSGSWIMAADKKLLTKEPHSIIVDKDGNNAVFSSDGKSLIFAGTGRTVKDRYGIPTSSGVVKICDVSSRRSRTLAEWGEGIGPLALSPDGTLLAGGTNEIAKDSLQTTARIIIIWKVKTGERLSILKSDQLVGLGGAIFSPDGKTLVAGASSKSLDTRRSLLTFWDIPSGKLLRSIEVGKNTSIAYDTQFSPDGKTFAMGGLARSGEYGKQESILEMPSLLQLWDVATGKKLAEYKGLKGPIHSVAFSPDGKLLAVGGNIGQQINEIFIWDLVKKERHAVLTGHRNFVYQVAFSHDGTLLATAGGSEKEGELRLWDVKKLREVASLKGHAKAVMSISFSPDDSLLASSGYGTVRLWYLREPAPAKDKHDR